MQFNSEPNTNVNHYDPERMKEMAKDLEILEAIKDQTGLTPENSNILDAFEDAKQRSILIENMCKKKCEEKGGYVCYNRVCPDNTENNCDEQHLCEDCLYRMEERPINPLHYDNTPTYSQALALLEKHGIIFDSLIKEELEKYINMKPTVQCARGLYEIKAPIWKLERALQEALELLEIDEVVIIQNFGIELEKIAGTYPNIQC